jgi:hypothetical protein
MPVAEAIWLGKYSGAAAATKDLKLSGDSTRVQIQIYLKKIRSSEALQAATVSSAGRPTRRMLTPPAAPRRRGGARTRLHTHRIMM